MSRKKIFTMAIDGWRNEIISNAASVFRVSKSRIIHDILSVRIMMQIDKMARKAKEVKWEGEGVKFDSELGIPIDYSREYKVIHRNFRRFLMGFPPEDVTCDELKLLHEKEKKLNPNSTPKRKFSKEDTMNEIQARTD